MSRLNELCSVEIEDIEVWIAWISSYLASSIVRILVSTDSIFFSLVLSFFVLVSVILLTLPS